MPSSDPLTMVSTRTTPQSMQADPAQARNAAGGYTFVADDLTRFRRFLATGTEGGTYYASEREHTIENAENVLNLVRTRGPEVLNIVTTASLGGHTVKQHPLMLTLAALVAVSDDETKAAALAALPDLCRTGTHLFLFAKYVEQFRGWGRGLRRAVGRWYLDQDVDRLAYQVAKYGAREGFTHRDLLRLSHPKPHALDDAIKALAADGAREPMTGDQIMFHPTVVEGRRQDEMRGDLFTAIVGGDITTESLPGALRVKDRLHAAADVAGVLAVLAEERSVSWEMVPSQWLADPRVWGALLDNGHVPLGALLRNLGQMTSKGVLDVFGQDDRTARVIGRLVDREALRKARVHPMSVLMAAATYASGRSLRGETMWSPIPQINKALDAAFPASFGSIEPIEDKRVVIGLDVSGSMDTSSVAGLPMPCRAAAAALAQVYAAQFPRNMGLAFTGNSGAAGIRYMHQLESAVTPLDVDPTRRLVDLVAETRAMSFGRTDCALPVLHALERNLRVDAFLVITDNETWAGQIHPHQALRQYRERTGIPARMVTVSMQANYSTIADPNDPLMLDVVGLDMSTVALVGDFLAGRV